MEQVLTNNVSAIVMAGLFIYYMSKRDKLMQDVFESFATKIEKLASAIEALDRRLKVQENTRLQEKEDKEV